MKKKCFMLTAIAMLCWVASSQAAITTTMISGDLMVQTDQEGVTGLKGCDAKTAKKRAAYVFELQQQTAAVKGTCRAGKGGRWTTIATQESEDGEAVFENLPDGHYRVLCKVGKAIGCVIENVEKGIPNRSIVYEREKEVYLQVDADARKGGENVRDIKDGLLVYPNPATSLLIVELDDNEMKFEITVAVYNLIGKELHVEKTDFNSSGKYRWQIETDSYPSGSYLLILTDINGKRFQRFFQVIRDK